MTAGSVPRVLDAAALLWEIADEVVVRTVRDTHVAWLDRVHGILRRRAVDPGGVAPLREVVHRGVAAGVYGGLGAGCRGAAAGLGALTDRGVGPALEDTPRGRFLTSAVDGIIGDRLARERPRLAVPLAVRRGGRDVPADPDALAAAFPSATGRVAVLLHGLSENESAFDRRRDEVGATYAETLAALGWTPVLLRANTGLGVRENGVVLDLVRGLGEEVPPLPHTRYHPVSATLARSPHHPVSRFLGDLLVRQPSAYGRSRRQPGLFPGADELHLPATGHLDLLNHPQVHTALRTWLG